MCSKQLGPPPNDAHSPLVPCHCHIIKAAVIIDLFATVKKKFAKATTSSILYCYTKSIQRSIKCSSSAKNHRNSVWGWPCADKTRYMYTKATPYLLHTILFHVNLRAQPEVGCHPCVRCTGGVTCVVSVWLVLPAYCHPYTQLLWVLVLLLLHTVHPFTFLLVHKQGNLRVAQCMFYTHNTNHCYSLSLVHYVVVREPGYIFAYCMSSVAHTEFFSSLCVHGE